MSAPSGSAGPKGSAAFLAGGGEMAAIILAKDWSRTALGPIEGWPQSLRTTVSLCLASNFPISIAWGPERVQIYNDSYRRICGAKHPHSMGQDFKECWFSAWPAIGEAFERAQTGQTSFLENQRMFLDRNGYLEEAFFTLSFSPIRDESGGVGGVFHPVIETTSRMLSERRIRALRDLASRAANTKTVEEACEANARSDEEERHKVEEPAPQESELRFRTIADYAPMMMWTCGADQRCDYFNRAWLQFAGRTAAEQLDEGWMANVHPDDRARCGASLSEAAAGGERFEIEFRARRHDGEYRWVFGAGAPRFSADGPLPGYVFSCFDIDDRRRAAQDAYEAQERLQLALDAGNEGLWDWNFATGECYFSPRYLSILGYEPGEVQPGYDLWLTAIHPDDMAAGEEQRVQQVRHLNGRFTTEYRLRKKNGDYIWIESNGKVITWTPNGTPARTVGTITDITGRRRLEEQYYQSQRLDSIGRLAGGVAHDFNNLLTVINGYAMMLLDEPPADSLVLEGLTEIREAGQRAAGLTQQLLAFSRKQILQPVVVNLNHIVTDVSKMLHRLIGEDIQLIIKLSAEPGNMTADPGQMQQIIMNLVVNSRDAMPGGGTLIIETANVQLDETFVRQHPRLRAGPHVVLAVTDTGTGMTPEVREQIFEPFFTTKPKSQGTGLGLATVYGIVTQSGGWIWVYSEPGKGTTFKLYFPRTEDVPAQETAVPKTNLWGTETILVVEDQEEVRKLTSKALHKYGYTVFSAVNAEEAIAFCERHEGQLDLVVTDIVMPGLNGRELAKRLAEMRPELLFLFMSGYTDNAIARHGVLDESLNYLQKPFTPELLAETVRRVLGPTEGP